MLDWLTRRRGTVHPERARRVLNVNDADASAPTRHVRVTSGKYASLYKYLANRYADSVVLTFGQIEDLLGFALPDTARARQDWWANTAPEPALPSHSDSWTLANRTARPNLPAQTVCFERISI